ncbi:VWA domain-containing protein [Solimonas sp. K1W22B-7]|uniref:VWA domain-containing protein n=1 Tax=Solimonas sp. K1W22B-7 TaxID=2303331 RepID=UPI0019690005|nr:VWA domain-containing protein [Solimonas sp. K1W22B-7]
MTAMRELTQGQRLKLSDLLDADAPLRLELRLEAPFALDYACFGVDAAGKLSNDAYMVFFNQLASPCGGVRLDSSGGGAAFDLDLRRLPAGIERLVFTATVDGAATMSGLKAGAATLQQGGSARGAFRFSGADFGAEKALLVAEVYRKDGLWRYSSLGQGFNGGLAALLKHFGGQLAEEAAPVAAPATPPAAPGVNLSKGVRLEKQLEKQAPKLVSLAKVAGVTLDKKGLSDHRAKVCFVLDVSGSMVNLFRRGVVQQVADRLLALACWFDDDRAVDTFLFDSRAIDAGPINLDNFSGRIQEMVTRHGLGGGTDYAPVIDMVRRFYGYGGARSAAAKPTDLPVYVLFVTDGGCTDKRQSEKTVREAAFEPIFWQFVGVGGARFDFLEKLDDLSGRFIDNADFGDISDPSRLSDQEMYERLMKEYPGWVSQAKAKGLLR